MSHRKRLTLILGACLCAATPLASAAGWVSILKNTPAEDFGEEDIRLFLDGAKAALDAPGPAKESSWSNPATGAGGKFLPLGPGAGADAACKRMRFTLHSRSMAGGKGSVWTLCKVDSDHWRVKSAR